jgi:hypothetical protein
MKWVFIIAGVLILITAVIYITGLLLPVSHTATVRAVVHMPVASAWRRITDFSKYQDWRKNIKKVELISSDEWVESDEHNNTIPYKMEMLADGSKLKTEITGAKLPFGGYWIIELNGLNNDTEITITEYGKVYNPVFRTLSKFVFGHEASIKSYLKYLGESAGANG